MCLRSHRGALAALSLALMVLPACALSASGRDLLEPHELRGWDVLDEAPVDPSADPDLVEWGVHAQRARHYSRDRHGLIQVCSVEVWDFESEAQAVAAAAGFSFPGWQIDAVGASVVMVRGLVRQRDGRSPRRGVFPECDAIGARIRERAGHVRP